MKYKIKVYQILEFGQRTDAEGNPHQEDSMFPAMGKANEDDRLFIVCDGMGGHDAGEVASATVCDAMSKSILEQQPDPQGDFTVDMLQKAIAAAFTALDAHDTGAEKKMGTTMTFLKLYDKGAMIAHMGDSRVYHIRPGKTSSDTQILHQTWDHSLVNDLIKIGELTPEEARTSRQKNVITRAMQPHMGRNPKADVYTTVDIKPGDYFYLCTDGMLENMDDEQIKYNFSNEAGDTERKRENLIDATQFNRDNHTAIIVEILDVIDPLPIPAKEEATPAPAAKLFGEVSDAEAQPSEDAASFNQPLTPEPQEEPAKPSTQPQVAMPQQSKPMRSSQPQMPKAKSGKTAKLIAILAVALLVVVVAAWLITSKLKKDEKSTDNNAAPKTEKVEGHTNATQHVGSGSEMQSSTEGSESEESESDAALEDIAAELEDNLSPNPDGLKDAVGGETPTTTKPGAAAVVGQGASSAITTVTGGKPEGNTTPTPPAPKPPKKKK